MRTNSARKQPWAQLVATGVGAVLLALGGCGTAMKDGLCKPAKNSGYTAATHDSWGEPWQIKITPEQYSGTCASAGAKGTFRVVASIMDSQNVPKPGVALSAYLNSASGDNFKLLPADHPETPSDTNTDSCGSAFFHVEWLCPAHAGEKHGGSLVISSGALSKSIDVSIEFYVPTVQ